MLIKEFLPNPVGADKDGEYIKLFNDADKAVNLAGWKIKDASGKAFNLSGSLESKKELILSASQTKISLNNNGETISLFDAKGVLMDELSYVGVAEEGKMVMNQKLVQIKSDLQDGQILNAGFAPSAAKTIGLSVFLGIILGLAAVYVILQLERKLDKNLY